MSLQKRSILRRSASGNAVRNLKHTFKILLLGDSLVGKTALLRQYVKGRFSDGESPGSSGSVEIMIKMVEINRDRIKLQFLDNSGKIPFEQAPANYYKNVDGAILVFDVTNSLSFDNVKHWCYKLDARCCDVKKILVGNKADAEQRAVSTEDACHFANQLEMKYFETTAKDPQKVEKAFEEIANLLYESKEHTESSTQDLQRSILAEAPWKIGFPWCCKQ